MEPLTGGIEHIDGPSFWVKVKEAFRQAGQAMNWYEAERDLREYEQQFTETVVNDYAAWKTGPPRQWTPETLDGWDYDHNYTGKKPQARLLYVNAAGTLSNPKHRNRIAGHIAIESDGKVFNYTPKGLNIVNARDYIHNITHRQQGDGPQAVYAYPLGLTAEERRQLAHELSLYYGKPYDLMHSNCATCTIGALSKATHSNPNSIKNGIIYQSL
ncbi:MAG: hypothetical protein QE263_05115 [Vampirovibrionales bacterium]|nr:hypothetical protein [Vampirovibrionales bacterium]